jgi:hypothetical protein
MGANSVSTGVLSRVKVAAVHKPTSIAEFTNEWNYTTATPIRLHNVYR